MFAEQQRGEEAVRHESELELIGVRGLRWGAKARDVQYREGLPPRLVQKRMK